jgi:hypothetical protein
MEIFHSGGVKPARTMRLSGFHTRKQFQRLSLTWVMATSGLEGLGFDALSLFLSILIILKNPHLLIFSLMDMVIPISINSNVGWLANDKKI